MALDDDCSAFAIHDLAALAEGNLSPEGMERLAGHIPQCRTCMETLVAMVDESQPSKGTGNKGLAAWLARLAVASDDFKVNRAAGTSDFSEYAAKASHPDSGQGRSRRHRS